MTAPALARETADGRRVYTHPATGQEVPSVTTVIAMIAKPKLTGWAARMAAEYAVMNWRELDGLPAPERMDWIRYAHERDSDKKKKIGTAVHEVIDAWAKGEPHECPKEASLYLDSFISFMFTHKPRFIANEFTVWSSSHEYAGTGDWIAEIGGKVVLGDTKSGKGVYGEAGLQVSALAHADHILLEDGTEKEIPAIDSLAVLHVRPRSWKFIPVCHDEYSWQAFLAAREIYEWNRAVAPYVFGGTP